MGFEKILCIFIFCVSSPCFLWPVEKLSLLCKSWLGQQLLTECERGQVIIWPFLFEASAGKPSCEAPAVCNCALFSEKNKALLKFEYPPINNDGGISCIVAILVLQKLKGNLGFRNLF